MLKDFLKLGWYMRYFVVLYALVIPLSSWANLEALPPKQMVWPFNGALGFVDRQAAQRGFQVYKEVCSVCHGLKHLYYRNLKDIGFSDDEIKEIAKQHTVLDGPNDQGEMFERPAVPSDRVVEPFKNEQAARAANNNALPVDLSLIVKAREDGANHVYSILTGYVTPPADFKVTPGLNYNPYFAGAQIAMPAPLTDGQVAYEDGTVASVSQMAHDVVIFLQWAAEPEMEHRKSLGLKAMIFLTFFILFFYVAKKRVWKDVNNL